MLGFWQAKMRNRMIFMYSFAPFLEEAGTLILGAKHLWYPWSVKRADELTKISYALQDRARTLRQRGLAWASNVSEFGEDPAYLLSTSVHHRYHNNDTKISCPEAVPYMVSAAIKLLFILLPMFKKVEELSYEEKGLVKWLSEMIETLMESPYANPALEISDNMIRTIGTHGILIECEGLSYTQATIEDSFDRKNRNSKRKKRSDLSDAELRKLAFEIGMPFEVVKEVFETEFSSWWNQATKYRNQAQAQRETFLSSLSAEDRIKEGIRIAWNPGTTTQNCHPECWGEKELNKSERIIKTFISMFLFFAENGESENPATLYRLSKKKLIEPKSSQAQ
ncbi:MAG: hypothetical protein HYT37_04005 [Candidatus Sungbacteria bacterium]|nr:hypothetical protein [Candidatus Sungbacteria bacterium]